GELSGTDKGGGKRGAVPLDSGPGEEAGAVDGEGEGVACGGGGSRVEAGDDGRGRVDGQGGGRRGVAAGIDDSDAGVAGAGDEGGGDRRGELGGTHKGGGKRGAVPLDSGPGEEAGAVDGEGEGVACGGGGSRVEAGDDGR